MIGSASAMRATGEWRRTAEASNPLEAERSAPRYSIASAISSADRDPAPWSSIAAVRLAAPNLLPVSFALPPKTTRLICTTGTSWSSTTHTGSPLVSCFF